MKNAAYLIFAFFFLSWVKGPDAISDDPALHMGNPNSVRITGRDLSIGFKYKKNSYKITRAYTVYTYDATQSDVVIDNTTFGTPLVAGDIVNIPKRSTGDNKYVFFRVIGLQCGVSNPDTLDASDWIHIVYASDAWMSIDASDGVSSFEDGNYGVHIYGYKAYRHATMFRHGGFGTILGYSHYMWIDSFQLIRSAAMTAGAVGTHTAFGGNVNNAYSHWYYTHGFIDTSVGLDASTAIELGAISTEGTYLSAVVRNCSFNHYYSPSLASGYITVQNSWGTKIHDNIFSNLGMVDHPGGHAAVIGANLGNGEVHNNFFGPNNFGNDLRAKGCDLNVAGYAGRWRYYNNISVNHRKYPAVENQDMVSGDSAAVAPYARHRSGPEAWNNGMYNVSIGNPPYVAAFYDNYSSDTVTIHNNYIVMVRDTTWSLVHIMSNAFGTPFLDTSNNRTSQFWPGIELQDSVYFMPILSTATLYHAGTTLPAYITTDYYGRAYNNPPSIGPVEYFNFAATNFWYGVYPVKIR